MISVSDSTAVKAKGVDEVNLHSSGVSSSKSSSKVVSNEATTGCESQGDFMNLSCGLALFCLYFVDLLLFG